MNISFRPLTADDFDLMNDWLNRKHVMRWWGAAGTNRQQVEEKYLPRVSGVVPCFGFIIENKDENQPIGYIQTHWLKDFPDYSEQIFTTEDALQFDLNKIACVDLFIGEEKFLYKGLGPVILRKFLREQIFGKMQAEICTLGPSEENVGAIRAYEKIGFKHWKTVPVRESGIEFILLIEASSLSTTV